jgi:hypothetical protein
VDVVGVEVQPAGGGDARVELAQSPGRGVPGVRVGLLALGEEPFIHLFELLGVHDDLAAHGEEGGDRAVAFAQAQGDGEDGAHVGSDALAAPAIAAGRGLEEDAVLVDELDGGAVELGLEDVLHGEAGPQALPQALVETAERRFGLV